jgi:hypothetical protein
MPRGAYLPSGLSPFTKELAGMTTWAGPSGWVGSFRTPAELGGRLGGESRANNQQREHTKQGGG